MTNGTDPDAAIRELLAATTDLARAQGVIGATEIPAPIVDTFSDFTKRVTAPIADSRRDVEDDHNATTATPAERPRPTPIPMEVQPSEVVDPDTVRLERAPDSEVTRTLLVLSGGENRTRLVGYLRPSGKKWQPLSPKLTAVGRAACQTRQAALLRLLDPHVPRS